MMRDEIKKFKKPYKNECAVINLDSSSGEGSHWTAYVKKGTKVLYFDSFGNLPPPKELQNYLSNYTIQYNHRQFQNYNTVNCGHLCINFLWKNTRTFNKNDINFIHNGQ